MPEEEKERGTPAQAPADGAPAADTEPAAQAEPPAEEQAAAEAPGQEAHKESAAGEAALKTKLEQAQQEVDGLKDRLLRKAAEFDNFRKRSAREHDAAFSDGVASAVTALLPVLDTLELAAKAETADENYKKGVLLTLEKSREVLAKLEVQEIEAAGRPFDPALHEAVMQQPASEETPAGTVAAVFLKGYTLHGRVVRHASVAVAQ